MSVSFTVKYSALQSVTPGAGFSGATAQPSAVGSPGTGYDAKSIARFDDIPYRAFSGVTNIGVVAFHMMGIDFVRFYFNGESAYVDVSEMTLNPMMGVVEYVASLNAEDCTAGVVEIRAVAYPTVGVPRVLDTHYLIAQPTGSSGQHYPVYAYVNASTGNDTTGVASPTAATAAATPCLTVGGAADKIKSYRNSNFSQNNCDNGVIRSASTSLAWTGGSGTKTCVNGWLTIEPVTTLTFASGSSFYCHRLHLKNLTLANGSVVENDETVGATASMWLDHVTAVGNGADYPSSTTPIGSNWLLGIYYNDEDISAVAQAHPRCVLSRNGYAHDLYDDAYQNAPLVINATVDTIKVSGTNHPDVWQQQGGSDSGTWDDNIIVYGLRATNIAESADNHGIFIRQDTSAPNSIADGMAFVNVYLPVNAVVGWYRGVDHLLIWNCTVESTWYWFKEPAVSGTPIPIVTNFSMKGSYILEHGSGDGGSDADSVDFSNCDRNRYGTAPAFGIITTPGTNATVGDPGLTAGRPANGSAVTDALSVPVVPVDADNIWRSTPTAIGAYVAPKEYGA